MLRAEIFTRPIALELEIENRRNFYLLAQFRASGVVGVVAAAVAREPVRRLVVGALADALVAAGGSPRW